MLALVPTRSSDERDPSTGETGGGPALFGRLVLAGKESSMDLERIRRAVREILLAVGEDPDREGLRETPDRVARMYAEVFEGLHQDPRGHLKKLFTQKYDEILLVKDIRLVSFCEHHLLPVVGKAHVAYIPNGKVIGLSKIPRVVDVLAKRPQMQERLTEEVADLLMKELDARGVAVVIEASHSCMTIRGVSKPDSTFVTSAMRGAFREKPATRSELMSLIFGSRALSERPVDGDHHDTEAHLRRTAGRGSRHMPTQLPAPMIRPARRGSAGSSRHAYSAIVSLTACAVAARRRDLRFLLQELGDQRFELAAGLDRDETCRPGRP